MIPVPIQVLRIDTIQTIDHEIHHTIETETIPTVGIEDIQIIEINVTKTIDQETIHTTNLIINELITTTIIIDHEIIHKIGIQIITINKEIIPNLLIGINNRYSDSQHKYRSNTPKHQRPINQVHTTEETTSDPLVSMIQKVLNYNYITLIVNQQTVKVIQIIPPQLIIITVENYYEPIIYEQPFKSNLYENQLELLQDYYTRPSSNNKPVTQEVNEINTIIKPERDEVQCSSTNHIYKNLQKELPKEKVWTIPLLLESPKM